MKRWISALLREPLLHFIVAGAVLFGGYELLHRGDASVAASPAPVHTGQGEINWIAETFGKASFTTPTRTHI